VNEGPARGRAGGAVSGITIARSVRGAVIAFGIGLIIACSRGSGRELDDAALRDADADSAEWLTYGRTYSEQRHSPLKQIDEASVSRLGLRRRAAHR
jgi:glucose dehydrogenase